MHHMKRPPIIHLAEVTKIAQKASAMLWHEFHRPGGVRLKSGKPLIDMEVEMLLRHHLTALHPCAWHGEETAHDPVNFGDVWVVDPLDGTSDFVARHRGSALSIALLRDGLPVLGVVATPVSPNGAEDVIAWAEGGDLLRNGAPYATRHDRTRPLVGFSADAADFAQHTLRVLPEMRVLASPSPARRLALVAVGDLDAAVSLTHGLESWDLAGGHALLIGAGLSLTDRHGQPIRHDGSAFDGCIAGPNQLISRLASAPLVGKRGTVRRKAKAKAPVSDAVLLDHAQGCLLGQLAGDALGSAVEFRNRADIARSHPVGVRDLADGGTWDLIAGQPTDDSEMALALARALISRNRFDEDTVAKAYIRWLGSRPFDIGHTTHSGISALKRGLRPSSDSQSNGALMRAAPLGIFAHGDPNIAAALARADAALTHPSAVCLAANAAFVAAISVAVAGGSLADMVSAAEHGAGTDQAAEVVRQRIRAAQSGIPEDFQHQMGWVLTALQNAFHWLLAGAPLEEALISTVAQGGDTDTNAAVCGALLGASQGYAGIPARWREAIVTCRPAPGSRMPRPQEYWPDDALELAEALIAAQPK